MAQVQVAEPIAGVRDRLEETCDRLEECCDRLVECEQAQAELSRSLAAKDALLAAKEVELEELRGRIQRMSSLVTDSVTEFRDPSSGGQE